MAQQKTNHLKIQFHICTICILWSPLISLLIHHTDLQTLSHSNACMLHAPAAVLVVAVPQPARVNRTKVGQCLLQAHLLALPLVLDRNHTSVIHSRCGKCAQRKCQIPMVPGATRTQGDGSSPAVFPACCAQSSFHITLPTLLRQETLNASFASVFLSLFPINTS